MIRLPDHIHDNAATNKNYYSLDLMPNIERAKHDPDYLGELLIVNENLIWHSIHKYIGKPDSVIKNYCLEKDDILQLGRMGFIKAIKAFDTRRGVKFSSFGVPAIVREIKCFLRDSASIIRPSRTANEVIQRICRIESELGYLPSVEDLSIMLDEPESRVVKALRVGQPVKYLDEPELIKRGTTDAGAARMAPLIEFVTDESDLESFVIDKVYADSIINRVRDKVSEKELAVLIWRVSGLNQTQTAEKEKISQMRVNRIMKKVANILKNHTHFG